MVKIVIIASTTAYYRPLPHHIVTVHTSGVAMGLSFMSSQMESGGVAVGVANSACTDTSSVVGECFCDGVGEGEAGRVA